LYSMPLPVKRTWFFCLASLKIGTGLSQQWENVSHGLVTFKNKYNKEYTSGPHGWDSSKIYPTRISDAYVFFLSFSSFYL
jgi:hypothetical protein